MYTIELEPRYTDIDTLGHVNNIVYIEYLQHARAMYYADVADIVIEGEDGEPATALVHQEIDYATSVHLEDTVTVALEVTEMGESSLHMKYTMTTKQETVATAATVQVPVNPVTLESRPVPAEWRRRIADYEGL